MPLGSYLSGQGIKVFSLVAAVPFAPLDIDLGHLARGEWNPLFDRFRLWHLPGEDGGPDACYVMIRKFDPADGVLIYGHMVVNLGMQHSRDGRSYTVGILANDEVRARAMLNSLLEIPPSFHRRSEVKVIEKRWRSDPEAVLRFLANVHSVAMNSAPGSRGKVCTLKFGPPPAAMGELKRGMSSWWRE